MESMWFVPRNLVAGKYHCAIEIVRDGTDCFVFVRSGVGLADKGDLYELESLMSPADIKYIIGRRPLPLSFDKAVAFMKKQTALKRA